MLRPEEIAKRKLRKKGAAEQGIALLMVLICLAIIMPFTASFNLDARVDWQSAVNAGDEVRARNVHRGALRLSLLLFELQRTVFNQKQFRDYMGTMDITQVAPYLMSVFGSEDGAEGLGALAGMDTSALSELSLGPNSSFEVRLEAESGKINLNCIAQASDGKRDTPRSRTVETLEALIEPTIFDPLFDEEKSDGERYDRQLVLSAIVDWIDDDARRFDLARLTQGGGPEPYRYLELNDPYQARNARMDSLQELHLVEGVDDDWMSAFEGSLTVYGGCKINLNFASIDQMAWAIRYAVSAEDKWKTEGDNYLLMVLPLANFVFQNRQWSLFKELEDFDKMVSKPEDFFATPFGDEDQQDQQSQMQNLIPTGIEIRTSGGSNKKTGDEWKGLKDIANVANERVYRVEVTTEVGAVRKRISAIYDMEYARSQSGGKGAWLYYREE
jgi:type II secretory pathway component PulK